MTSVPVIERNTAPRTIPEEPWESLADFHPDFIAPETADININGVCNLNCPWCWGPEHSRDIETVTAEEWKTLFSNLHAAGTKGLVFSGGETLLKPELPELLTHAAQLGMRNTLSTNGLLLPRRYEKVLPFVNDLGIPVDGSTEAINARMRVPLGGRPKHLGQAIKSLRLTQELYPDIELTVRTVIAKPNLGDVHRIGRLLLENGIDGDKLRWKLYQCTPTGPRKADILEGDWLITGDEFEAATERVHLTNPEFTRLSTQSIEDRDSRYFFVFPDGSTSISGEQYGVAPTGDPLYAETPVGNIVENFAGVMQTLWHLGYTATKH